MNSIPNLFEAMYFATPTLGHSDFPLKVDSAVEQEENQIIRKHLESVYLQAERDALNMIHKMDASENLAEIKHSNQQTALEYAIMHELDKLVQAMLERKIDANLLNKQGYEGVTPLSHAVWRKNEKIVKMLVEAGADEDEAVREDRARDDGVAVAVGGTPDFMTVARVVAADESAAGEDDLRRAADGD